MLSVRDQEVAAQPAIILKHLIQRHFKETFTLLHEVFRALLCIRSENVTRLEAVPFQVIYLRCN